MSMPSERQMIERIAQEYRERGYSVFVEPKANEMPEFLKGTQPDILVLSPNENIVIEVKQTSSLKHAHDIPEFARLVEAQPRWRFELITIQASEPTGNSKRWNVSEIRERIKEAQLAAASGYAQAAYLLAYATLEAALFAWVESQEAQLSSSEVRWSTRAIARQMVISGVLGEKEFEQFRGFEDLRNRLAHAVAKTEASSVDIESLLKLVNIILSASTWSSKEAP